ncbi:MAG TPA: lipid IV(A) palmitoyltransferase PagP [Elusimicrobiota bacterium]|nr:lipid IV(A) palmitoyltransferase PagP [Elusimicrobiota bacterium]
MPTRHANRLSLGTLGFSALLIFLLLAGRPAFADGSVAASSGTVSAAGPDTWYGDGWGHLKDTWGKGGYELYLPFYTYHMPYAYSPALLRSYNDIPVGGGLGKGRFNERGNWEGLYVMEFADSHSRPQYEGGYAWISTWRPFHGVRLGAGVTGFVFARSDIDRYTPLPGILPLASIGFKNLDIQTTFVPGGRNNGNVLFSWLKLSFY